MEKKTFTVNRMACDHCRAKVERTLSCLRGVDSAEVDLTHHTVMVTYDEELIKPANMKKAVDEAGCEFQVQPLNSQKTYQLKSSRTQKLINYDDMK